MLNNLQLDIAVVLGKRRPELQRFGPNSEYRKWNGLVNDMCVLMHSSYPKFDESLFRSYCRHPS